MELNGCYDDLLSFKCRGSIASASFKRCFHGIFKMQKCHRKQGCFMKKSAFLFVDTAIFIIFVM